MRQVIRGHQWSSVVISGHQWSSAVISGHQRSSDAGTHLPELVVCQKRAVAGVVYRDVWNEPNALMVSAPSSRPSSWPNSTRTCHQRSSVVIIGHHWSSVVISGHQWSSVVIKFNTHVSKEHVGWLQLGRHLIQQVRSQRAPTQL